VTILNFVLIQSDFKLKNTEEVSGEPNKEGLRFFAITIFYLFSLFSALLIDNLILL
jgi:heme O synthase-like polyprenyltransferase